MSYNAPVGSENRTDRVHPSALPPKVTPSTLNLYKPSSRVPTVAGKSAVQPPDHSGASSQQKVFSAAGSALNRDANDPTPPTHHQALPPSVQVLKTVYQQPAPPPPQKTPLKRKQDQSKHLSPQQMQQAQQQVLAVQQQTLQQQALEQQQTLMRQNAMRQLALQQKTQQQAQQQPTVTVYNVPQSQSSHRPPAFNPSAARAPAPAVVFVPARAPAPAVVPVVAIHQHQPPVVAPAADGHNYVCNPGFAIGLTKLIIGLALVILGLIASSPIFIGIGVIVALAGVLLLGITGCRPYNVLA